MIGVIILEAKLFDKCKCKGFYKRAHDGLFIHLDEENLTADLINTNLACADNVGVVEEDIDCAEKRYYEHKEGNFNGIIVGFVDLVVTGWLDVIYDAGVDTGFGTMPDKYYIAKRAKEVVRCAIVYYANNMKHYTPIDDIVEIIE